MDYQGLYFEPTKMEPLPEAESPAVKEEETAGNVDHADATDNQSVESDDSDGSLMEFFDTYRLKIKQLLTSINLKNFSIEVIQHGYDYINCVYGIKSSRDPAERYVLRVAIKGVIRESDGRHATIENDIAVLGYLRDRLPVPRIKAYSATIDNILEAAYTVQTRIQGDSLNKIWAGLDWADKRAIVDEFIDLLAKLESITFATAGTLSTPAPLPAKSIDSSNTEDPVIRVFDAFAREPLTDPNIIEDRAGPNVKSLLRSHLDMWIQEELGRNAHELDIAITPRFKKMLAMLEEMDEEGFFNDQPFPVVLHHWDLEPRNLMVSKASGFWKISGVIDWDGASALPTPLARVPPRWIWRLPHTYLYSEDDYLNNDQYGDPELPNQNKELKAYFDTRIEAVLPGYTEDAYERGRWMRRIWHFAKEGAYKPCEWEFLDQLPEEWAARRKHIVKLSGQI